MKLSRTLWILLAAQLVFVLGLRPAQAQTENATEKKTPDILANLKFRNLGPASAGGRVTSVVGIPGNPSVYYVGAAGGGVFKTMDGGLTWKPVFEHESTASIGAIALAPSNPNFVWVGTGEANIRNDVIDGHGVYFSSDAGHSWKFMGLAETQQISSIAIDPSDPNTVFVGALGHSWAPNADRGVYRTTDGGKTWKKVLYVNDSTGVSDLTLDAGNPKVIFAGMWEFRRFPWTLMDGGSNTGLYRSTDGGDTWEKLTKGLPESPLGRIAVAAAPSNPDHIYALIGAKKGMLWQSLDSGDSWSEVTSNRSLDVRAFYFSKMLVSPDDQSKIFFLSFNLMESDDGGKTAHPADRGVHSDHHALWIDPKDPNRMIQGGDGGVFLSMDGSKTWRFLDGLPIEQFYQVATDSRVPYDICGGLQDNSAWCGPSSDLSHNNVPGTSWYTTTGGDGEYSVPAPSDPDIVYSDAQNGDISRLDLKTHISEFIRPYVQGVEETKPSDLKYRFNWTTPIAVSPTDANEVYLGGNVLFKSTDGGKTWNPISGDLTHNDKSKQEVSGGPVNHDISGAETYGTIMSITLAPSDPKVIWVGTDDGYVQVTRDGGKNWTNVTSHISGAPDWARVYQIGVSPFDAGTAYAIFDAHMLDNRHAYAYRTTDFGASWTKISDGLPDVPVYVVREDPNQRGFLVAGTDVGLFYSSDSGGHWSPLKADFPTVPVWDLKFVKRTHDLVVATHGRGIFVLDDIRPLEELTPEITAGAFHLFTPSNGTILHHWRTDEGQHSGYAAPNAPEGVVIDYLLKAELKPTPEQKKEHQTPVKIVISDGKGNPVTTEYGPSEAGINRFVWNLRYEGPTQLKSAEPQQVVNEAFNRNRGPLVIPGTYKISVAAEGKTESQSATVEPDPNLHVDPAVFRAQTEAALHGRSETSAMNEMLNRIDDIQKEISEFASNIQNSKDEEMKAKYAPILKRGRDLSKKLSETRDVFIDPDLQSNVPEDDIHGLVRLQGQITSAGSQGMGGYGQMPNPLVFARAKELYSQLDEQLKKFNDLLKTDVAEYNKAAVEAGAPTVFAGPPIEVKTPKEF